MYDIEPGEITFDHPSLIHPRDAVHRLSPVLSSDEKAKKLLAGRIIDMSLKIRADWIAYQADVGPPPKEVPIENSEGLGPGFARKVSTPPAGKKITVGGALMKSLEPSNEILARWSWATATFVLPAERIALEPSFIDAYDLPNRWVIAGVRFDRAAIDQLVSEFLGYSTNEHIPAKPDPHESRRVRGPVPGWEIWVAELVHEAIYNNFHPKVSANEIYELVEERAARSGLKIPARSTVYPTAQAVADRLKTED